MIRVMIRSTVTHWDCILRDAEERNDWLAGISLAYGLQTVPIISPALQNKEGGAPEVTAEDAKVKRRNRIRRLSQASRTKNNRSLDKK